jgi:hypothetical protein
MGVYLPIQCQGETHEVEITDDGEVFVLDHDIEEELAMAAFGAELPGCLKFVEVWNEESPIEAITYHAGLDAPTLVLLAADWVEHVLWIYEELLMVDRSPRTALKITRRLQRGEEPRWRTKQAIAYSLAAAKLAKTWTAARSGATLVGEASNYVVRGFMQPDEASYAAKMAAMAARTAVGWYASADKQTFNEAAADEERDWQVRRFIDVMNAIQNDEPWPPLEATP